MCAMAVIDKRSGSRPMTEEEWALRVDLACCYRLVAHFDMDDLFATHISARVPGADEHFLINPLAVHFSEVTASNLVKVDLDGAILDDTDHVINPAGYVIHSAIHGARPDAKCVLHTHTVAGMAIATMTEGLKSWFQKATRYHNRVAYHDFEGKAEDLDERERLVRDLGDRNYLVLRNHGLLVCAPSVPQAFREMYAMEKACKTQLAIMSAGGERVPLSDNLLEHTAGQFDRDATVTKKRPDGWASLRALADKVSPGYEA